MTRCVNIAKIRCLLYHFIIVLGDTLTYNDIPCGVMSLNIPFILCAGSQCPQWWDKMKVKVDCHTVVNHWLQYTNLVYVSLVVTCFSVLMVKQFAWYLVSIMLHNILRRVPLVE